MRIKFSFPTVFACLLVAMSTQPILSAQNNLDVALLKNVRPIGGRAITSFILISIPYPGVPR
jgi:hypothetical protein